MARFQLNAQRECRYAPYLELVAKLLRAEAVHDALRTRQILVRFFNKPPLDGWLRITIGTRDQLTRVLAGITEALNR